ncbi:Pectate lyase [Actinidia chinensis var. chinensis]|uniref:Pectate lyase n=1 Tax=Actinidia chinensis var. chinensis TaxID=1590841 RepID=A0A2R6Q9W7_ACTCC|nr:Pectate lyase [Actinidia chinensis var. chinensis]
MKCPKILFMLALVMTFSTSLAGEEFLLGNDNEDVKILETSDIPFNLPETLDPTSLRGTSRFLAQTPPRAKMTCDKYPRVCRAKGSTGPDCCKTKCVDVKTDRLNCGMCGKTSSYSPTYNTPTIYKPNKKVMNVIDSCWRKNPNWASNRQALAECAVGFGKNAMGGKAGLIYVVTDPSDDPINPKPGTLRYGAIQTKPLWIIFGRDMVITLKNELMLNSYKTIDGRGAKVEIAYGPCITVQRVRNIIIHGISIHDCKPGKAGIVRDSVVHAGHRLGSDGDAIDIFASSNVWIDHCSLARAADGLIDVIHASTAITISNNYFSQHDKVMLLGHNDQNTEDKVMRVTIVFNRFGSGLIQRMPRVRLGYTHVANNKYDEWQMYAIGGSANPTIFSEGNYYIASKNANAKQVTKREESKNGWKNWKWRSSRDVFVNGAYFVPSGWGSCNPNYSKSQSFTVAHGSMVPALTSDAGPLGCVRYKAC